MPPPSQQSADFDGYIKLATGQHHDLIVIDEASAERASFWLGTQADASRNAASACPEGESVEAPSVPVHGTAATASPRSALERAERPYLPGRVQ